MRELLNSINYFLLRFCFSLFIKYKKKFKYKNNRHVVFVWLLDLYAKTTCCFFAKVRKYIFPGNEAEKSKLQQVKKIRLKRTDFFIIYTIWYTYSAICINFCIRKYYAKPLRQCDNKTNMIILFSQRLLPENNVLYNERKTCAKLSGLFYLNPYFFH